MPETIGQQLKKARERKNLSLKAVVEEIHIRESYLAAIEEDRLEEILSPVQAKGFVRLYAEFLGVTPLARKIIPEENPSAIEESPLEEATIQNPETTEETADQEQSVPPPTFAFGALFSIAREEKGLGLTEVERELHVSKDYLVAIETEDLDALPQGIQARGMLQRYADYLGLNTEEVLEQYADLLINKQNDNLSNAKKRKSAKKVDGARQFFTPDMLIGIGLVLAILIAVFFTVQKIISTRNLMITNEPTIETAGQIDTPLLEIENTPTATEAAGVPVSEDVATATLQVRPTNEAEANLSARVILQIIASQRAYIRVTTDGEIAFEGRVQGGNFYEFYAEESIELLTGNAAALDVTVLQDGRETRLGVLGLVGQVVTLTFEPDVIITPTVTPSMTPTVTNTPQPSATPTITSTATPTE